MAGNSPQLTCQRCNVPLEYKCDRYLIDEAWYALIKRWMAVSVFECPQCGHIELFNPDALNRAEQDQDEENEDDINDPAAAQAAQESLMRLGLIPGRPNGPNDQSPGDQGSK